MKKLICPLLFLTVYVFIPFVEVDASNSVKPDYALETVQGTSLVQSVKNLEIALPESATIRLIEGGSYTGKLTSFSSANIILSASGQSRTIPRSHISQIELRGTVWIPNPDGNIEAYAIRGISQPLENVPVDALTWDGVSSLAILNLQGVMTQGEFNRLNRNPELVYALVRMQFDSSDLDKMNVRIKALGQ